MSLKKNSLHKDPVKYVLKVIINIHSKWKIFYVLHDHSVIILLIHIRRSNASSKNLVNSLLLQTNKKMTFNKTLPSRVLRLQIYD